MDPIKKTVRRKRVRSPEEEAAKKERRRQQLVDAQARRRARLVEALEQAESAVLVGQEVLELRAQVRSLQYGIAQHNDRQVALELAYERLEAENKRLREKRLNTSDNMASPSFVPSKFPAREEAIVQELTQSGGAEINWLENYASLAKKWAADAKATATKLKNIHEVTVGLRVIEGNKLATSRFKTPILSEEENRILTNATLVLGRISGDVDRAAHRVDALYKLRESERQERLKKAEKAIVIFDQLDVENKILLVAMEYSRNDSGWGSFRELIRGIDKPEGRDRWWKASIHFEGSYKERRDTLIRKMADLMKENGRTADELASEAFQKFLDAKPRIAAEWSGLVSNIKTELVKERLG